MGDGIAYNTTNASCRGSTVRLRSIGSHRDRSTPPVRRESLNLYFPLMGFPDEGSTLAMRRANVTGGAEWWEKRVLTR